MRALIALLLVGLPVVASADEPWNIDYPPQTKEAMKACGRLQADNHITCAITYYSELETWGLVVGARTGVEPSDALWAGKKIALQLCATRGVTFKFVIEGQPATGFICLPGGDLVPER